MEPNSVQWVGSPCGLHGPYIFYKAFQFHLEGRPRILSLGDFFFVRCKPQDPICIAELQLLWEERTSRQLLSSSKLYFLPEDTPQGRNSDHGEVDEVIAASEKVTVKLEDLAKWAQADFSKWKHGLRGEAVRLTVLGKNGQKEALTRFRQSTHNSGLNFKDILKEKADLGEDDEDANVLILSYPQYCRYRSMLKRIQDKPSSILTDQFVLALGGIAVLSKNPQILYCRDTFDHPTLIENESICDEFAPNLKGRPRKKKPCPQRRDSLNGIKDSNNNCESRTVAKVKCEAKSPLSKTKNNNSNCKKGSSEDKSKVSVGECRADEQAFLVALYKYMKERKTPIERIPYLGFKQINLWTMFQAAQKLGGYETITARRQWKHIYDELGGNPGSTSAATCTRRHYERLILPYERFIKGEEDKPLPPVKPRKQDNITQEGESKTKLSGTKRIKNENQKNKKEKDSTQKTQEAPEVSSEQAKDQECPDHKRLSELTVTDEMKPSVEGPQVSPPDATSGETSLEKTDLKETTSNTEEIKEEMTAEGSFSSALVATEEDVVLDSTLRKLPSPSEDTDEPKQEPGAHSFADNLESEAQEIPFTNFPTIQIQLPSQNEMEDDKLPEMADYIANCTVKVDQLGNEDIHNALKQSPKVLVVQNFDMFKEKELPGSINGDPGFSYTPLIYSKGNPGIMSPLAKKKLLSQVSGATLSCNYPYGSPPPLISKKKLNNRDELPSGMSQTPHAPLPEAAAISRPSVIQHVQSFKPKNSEERKSANETYRHESLLKRPDSECCDFTKQHLSTLAESYALKSDIQDMKDRMNEKRALHHSHMPTFLADFYSSPHLHSLYRHTEHHLNNEQVSKYLPRDMYRDSENLSMFSQHKHQDKRSLSYHPPLHQHEKKAPLDVSSDDQPTDLSLPKMAHKQTTKALGSGLVHASAGQQESKSMSQFQGSSGQPLSIGCHPKACRVSPMTVSAPKKHGESLLRPGKQQNLRKMEGMVHPILSHKSNAQTIGAARPLKRSLEDLDKAILEKKIRAVSPLRLPKEAPAKDKGLEPEAEGSKSVHGLPSSGMLEGHKFPLSNPIFTGLYPGTLCSGLSNRIPAGYSHPLQYLKNQSVLSPLMQPLALHSFMVQRQFLASPGNSQQQLYRHLAAAAAPVGSSYGDLLHNNIYPLAAINPQAAFPPSQLSSVHPSTKL